MFLIGGSKRYSLGSEKTHNIFCLSTTCSYWIEEPCASSPILKLVPSVEFKYISCQRTQTGLLGVVSAWNSRTVIIVLYWGYTHTGMGATVGDTL